MYLNLVSRCAFIALIIGLSRGDVQQLVSTATPIDGTMVADQSSSLAYAIDGDFSTAFQT